MRKQRKVWATIPISPTETVYVIQEGGELGIEITSGEQPMTMSLKAMLSEADASHLIDELKRCYNL